MNYSYLILVAVGLVLAVMGFIRNGKDQSKLWAAILFLAGTVLLTLGILLTSVPGFFSG